MAGKGEGKQDGISRRDFLDGVAISAAGLAAAAAAPHLTGAEAALAATHGGRPQPPTLPPGYYPPTATGLTGEPDHVIEKIYKIDGKPDADAAARHSSRGGPGVKLAHVVDDGECYDCVIVGAGASGLAAAKFYRDRFGADKKVLLLDPLPDFGGHSHRNEFHVPNAAAGGAEVTILRNGGTVNLDSIGAWDQPAGGLLDIPGSYGQPALDMLDFCGVDIDSVPEQQRRRRHPARPTGCGRCCCSRPPTGARRRWRRTATTDRAEHARGLDGVRQPAPLLAGGQGRDRADPDRHDDRLDLRQGRPDDDQEKKRSSAHADHVQAVPQELRRRARGGDRLVPALSHGLLGAGAQAVSAADCWMLGQPASTASGCPTPGATFPGVGRTPQRTTWSTPSRRGRGRTATRRCSGCSSRS